MIILEDQIAAVERLIEDFRWTRGDRSALEHATFNALKQIATDLRGRMAQKPGETRKHIGRRIADAVRSKTALGYEQRNLAAIGAEVIGRWPTIEYALERVEREEKVA